MNSYADPNIEGWFAIRGLPWSKETAMKLREQGAECVDDLKFLDLDVVNSLFKDEKPVVKAKAKAAWKDLEVNNEQAIRDIESQGEQLPASTVPEVCITAGISVFLSILGLVFGIVSCAKAAEAYDCYYSYSYNYYYNEYGREQIREYGCDRDTARKALDVARGMALTSAIFYAIATPLAFYAGRAYLPSKTREGIQTNRACPNPRCCPFNMALYSWLFYLGALAWTLSFLVFIYVDINGSYSSYNGGFYSSALVPNFVAWSMMFGYAEMVRRYKEDISTCC